MAEEKVVASGGEPAAADKGGGKQVLMMIGLSIMVMVLTPIITIVAFKLLAPNPSVENVKNTSKAETGGEGFVEQLPTITTNVANTQGSRLIKMQTAVQLSNEEIIKYFKPAGKGGDGTDPSKELQIKDILLGVVGSKNLDQLLAQDAKATLKKEIRQQLNDYIREKLKVENGMVSEVYITDMVISGQ